MGPIHFIKDCEWEYTSTTCPPLPADATQYNWECNPFTDICEPGQYDMTPEAADHIELRRIETIIQEVEEMDFAYTTATTTTDEPARPYPIHQSYMQNDFFQTEYVSAEEPETTEQPTTSIPVTTFSSRNVEIAYVVTELDTTPEPTTKRTTTHRTRQPHARLHRNLVTNKLSAIRPGHHRSTHHKPAPQGPPPPSLPPSGNNGPDYKHRLPEWRRNLLDWAMTPQTEGEQIEQPPMVNDFTENGLDYANEPEYQDFDDYEYYAPRARPVTNIVNFFNDGRGPEVIQRHSDRQRQTERGNSQGEPVRRPYPIHQSNMQNDFVQPEYARAEESNDEAHHTERLHKRVRFISLSIR